MSHFDLYNMFVFLINDILRNFASENNSLLHPLLFYSEILNYSEPPLVAITLI